MKIVNFRIQKVHHSQADLTVENDSPVPGAGEDSLNGKLDAAPGGGDGSGGTVPCWHILFSRCLRWWRPQWRCCTVLQTFDFVCFMLLVIYASVKVSARTFDMILWSAEKILWSAEKILWSAEKILWSVKICPELQMYLYVLWFYPSAYLQCMVSYRWLVLTFLCG